MTEAATIPVEWIEVGEEEYEGQLDLLPLEYWDGLGFLVGEPFDRCPKTGHPRFSAYVRANGRFYSADRPMTVREFKSFRLAKV